jgi:YbgC/YbaW family acyl-CoA thioester hydrolase
MEKYARFQTSYRVRPDDIDLFRHVHNSRYFDYVMAARYDHMRLFYGMSMEDFMESGYGWVVKTAHVEYKRPLVMGQEFSVETGIESINARGCRVSFEIRIAENKKIACDGWFDYILIDIITGRSLNVTEEMIEKYSI